MLVGVGGDSRLSPEQWGEGVKEGLLFQEGRYNTFQLLEGLLLLDIQKILLE